MAKAGDMRDFIPRAVLNLIVALLTYLFSLFVPSFFAGIYLPGGLPEPYNSVEWLVWAFLMVLALVFLAEALILMLRAIDPVLESLLARWRGDVKPAKRLVRDVAYIILVLLVAEVLNAIASSLGSVSVVLRLIIGFGVLLMLALLVYDIGKTAYSLITSRIEAMLNWLKPGGEVGG